MKIAQIHLNSFHIEEMYNPTKEYFTSMISTINHKQHCSKLQKTSKSLPSDRQQHFLQPSLVIIYRLL